MEVERTRRAWCRNGLLAGMVFVSGCAGDVGAPPNVVLIVVDTLRVDRLPFHGCPKNTAPFLDELARESLVFENAWSPSSWTLPAAISTMTSVHPFQHGVTNLEGLELGPDDEPVPVNCIPDEVETLAETLGREGYRTFGIVSNVLVGEEVGFDRGFDKFIKLEDEDADVVNEHVAKWRDEMLASEPYFLYVHYFDPHDTLHAREPWFDLARAAESGWTGRLPREVPETDTDLDWFLTRLEPGPDWPGERRAKDLSPDELHEVIAWIRAAYDSEIGFVDSRIRALHEMLRLDDAVVLFLADHGEEFYEHGDLTHGQNLYSETTRVPLLIHLPGEGARTGRVQTHVSTLDVVPTLRGVLGLPPSAQDRGRDLLADQLAQEPVLGHLGGKSGQHPLEDDMRSIVVGKYRLITRDEGHVELYDVEKDPAEATNLTSELRGIASDLARQLEREVEAAPRYPRATRIPGAASETMREHLRGIGYAGDDE